MFEKEYVVTMLVHVQVYAASPKDAEELATESYRNWHDWNVADTPGGIVCINIQETER